MIEFKGGFPNYLITHIKFMENQAINMTDIHYKVQAFLLFYIHL